MPYSRARVFTGLTLVPSTVKVSLLGKSGIVRLTVMVTSAGSRVFGTGAGFATGVTGVGVFVTVGDGVTTGEGYGIGAIVETGAVGSAGVGLAGAVTGACGLQATSNRSRPRISGVTA
ncbi:MAG: hypothetical protein HYX87_01530 [Chloroflexi bacterium]|nr:hypothetical protein [Chloroflexota bacterium]